MTPAVYRALRTSYKTSTNVFSKLVFPTEGLADFSISVWVRIRSAEIARGMFAPIFGIAGATGAGFPNAFLQLYTPISISLGDVSAGPVYDVDQVLFDVIDSRVRSPVNTRKITAGVWHHIVWTFEAGVEQRLYIDGVLLDTMDVSSWSTTNPGDGGSVVGGGQSGNPATTVPFVGDLANIAAFDRVLSADDVEVICAMGVDADIRQRVEVDPGDYWLGETPSVYYIEPAVAGAVPNSGSGGACDLGVAGGYEIVSVGTASTSPVARSRTTRNPNTQRYPPVTALLKTRGTVYSRWALAGTSMSRLFFPDGGGLGTASLSFWFKRPLLPVVRTGTLVQVAAGGSSIKVDLGVGDVPTVTITDGTHTQSLTLPATVVDKLTLLQLVSNPADDELIIYIDGVAVGVIDTSTIVPPDVDWGLDFTLGTLTNGTQPHDVYFMGVAGFADDISAVEAEALATAGPTWDVRDPTPTGGWAPSTPEAVGPSPTPAVFWRDEPNDSGEVPNAMTSGEELIPFNADVEFITVEEADEDIMQFLSAYQELLPPGPIWETESDENLYLLMEALAIEATRVYTQTDMMVRELRPFSTEQLVPEWEKVLGLPDTCDPPPSSLEARQAAISARFLARGGQTTTYYIGLLKSVFGVDATIDENWPWGVPSRAGDGTDGSGSVCGDPISSLSTALTFRVNVPGSQVGSQEIADRLECLIRRVKPAHTNVIFNYT